MCIPVIATSDKKIAGSKSVGVVGPDVVGQCIAADESDELGNNLVPVLLGSGIPMFRGSVKRPKVLQQASVNSGNGVVNLFYTRSGGEGWRWVRSLVNRTQRPPSGTSRGL